MILAQNSKYLSNLLFCNTFVLSFDDVVFSKGAFQDDKKNLKTKVEKFFFFSKGLTYDSGKKFQYLSNLLFRKTDLFFTFQEVVYSKGGFLDDKDFISL